MIIAAAAPAPAAPGDFRMQADPKTFFVTDHYRGYPTVLIRLATVTPADLRDVLEQAWRRSAPKR